MCTYFSRISAESSALIHEYALNVFFSLNDLKKKIHEYANMFDSNELK